MKKIIAGALVLVTTQLMAANAILSPVTKVKKVFVYKTAAVLELETPMNKEPSCTYNKSGKYVALRFSEAGSKEMFATVLSAYAAGMTVKIGTKGCDNIWSADGTMNKIYRVTLQK